MTHRLIVKSSKQSQAEGVVETSAYGSNFDRHSQRGNYRVNLTVRRGEIEQAVRIRVDYDMKRREVTTQVFTPNGQDWNLLGHLPHTPFPNHEDPFYVRSEIARGAEATARTFALGFLNGTPTPTIAAGEPPVAQRMNGRYHVDKGRLVITDTGLRQAVEKATELMNAQLLHGLAIHNAAKAFNQNPTEIATILSHKGNLQKQRAPLENRLERATLLLHRQNAGFSIADYGTKEKPTIPELLRLEAEDQIRNHTPLAGIAEELLTTLEAAKQLARQHELPFEVDHADRSQ